MPTPIKPASLKAIVPVLPAVDVLESLCWWTAICGFSELFRDAETPTYAGIVREGLELHLARITDPAVARHVGSQTMIRFHVDDLDTFYADYKRRGGKIHPNGDLQIKPWGAREFAAYDPNGVCVSFMQL